MIRRAVLQLNASYEPLRIISLKKAMTLLTKGVAVTEVPTDILIHLKLGIYLPSVIRLRHYRHVPIRMQVVSRRNIILRDGSRCMYCGVRSENLTLDHVIPKSRGGRNTWDNLVACCPKDNHRKGDKTPEEAGMKLIRRPLPQSIHTPRFLLRSLGAEVEEWGRFLYQNSEGDKRFQFN
jgi:5-methylcytosine-specific restriction endonuclease McrA